MKDLNDFKAKYPDIYAAIFKEGQKAGLAEGIKQSEAALVIKKQTEVKRRQEEARVEAAAFDKLSIEDKAQLAWDSNTSLQKEFRKFDTYLSYIKGVADGRVKIFGRKPQ